MVVVALGFLGLYEVAISGINIGDTLCKHWYFNTQLVQVVVSSSLAQTTINIEIARVIHF